MSMQPGFAFRATIELGGQTATGIEVPPQAVAALGASRRPPVHVTLDGYAYRSTIATMRGRFMLPISAAVRASAGVAAGDEVDVELALDDEPRELTVPADFAAALDTEARAREAFKRLSYGNRLRWVLSVEGAKTEATRERRIAKAVHALREDA
jgi:Domain of unknown function (DUF1905)/Bacteriocin-protection, YdeI or OmpD-Associated